MSTLISMGCRVWMVEIDVQHPYIVRQADGTDKEFWRPKHVQVVVVADTANAAILAVLEQYPAANVWSVVNRGRENTRIIIAKDGSNDTGSV